MKEDTLGRELKQLGNLIKRNIDNHRLNCKREEITGMNGMIIHYLYENRDKEIFQKDIEREFSIRRSTVTGIISLMEEKNLIKRVSVEADKRLKKIVLTDKSFNFVNTIKDECIRIDKTISKGLTEEEIEVFINILRKISDNLK
ncbi:MAG: MarR family transcriptional regulator [Bacilli bacterium]|nr:MarR family transcriptional regulator [Bacilli bacterium]